MNKAPAFQVYPKDYETDEKVKLMTLEQEGAYWRLLLHESLEGSVPADISGLALICRIPKSKMRRLWTGTLPLCFPPFPGPPGRLANPRMERDRRERQEFFRGKAEAGRLGGLAKAKQTPSTMEGAASDSRVANPAPSSSSSPSSPENGRPYVPPDVRTEIATRAETDVLLSDRGPRENPLVKGRRQELEAECLQLVTRMAALTGEDPIDVMARGSHYERARSTKLNPASMTDDRLAHTVRDLRADVAAAEKRGRPEGGSSGP